MKKAHLKTDVLDFAILFLYNAVVLYINKLLTTGDRKKHRTPIIPNVNAVKPKALYLFLLEYLKHQTVNKISATIDVIIAKNGIESVAGLLSPSAPIANPINKNKNIKLKIDDTDNTKYLIQFFTKSPPLSYFHIHS